MIGKIQLNFLDIVTDNGRFCKIITFTSYFEAICSVMRQLYRRGKKEGGGFAFSAIKRSNNENNRKFSALLP